MRAYLDNRHSGKITANQEFRQIERWRDRLIAEGDLVVIHMPIEGTFTNQLMGIPPNGKKVSLWMCNVWKVVGGRAVEWWINMDTLGLMQQLGVIPPQG